MTVRPAKTQIRLGISPVWSESLLCAQWVAKDPIFHHADSEDSDQTGRMPGRSESSLCAHSLCWFCHEAAHMVLSHIKQFQSFKWIYRHCWRFALVVIHPGQLFYIIISLSNFAQICNFITQIKVMHQQKLNVHSPTPNVYWYIAPRIILWSSSL